MLRKSLTAVAILLCFATTPLLAEETLPKGNLPIDSPPVDSPPAGKWNSNGTWTFGLIASGGKSIYVGEKNKATVLPYLAFDSERLHFGVDDGLAYHFLNFGDPQTSGGQLSLVLAPRWETALRKSSIFDGMDRDLPIEGGVRGRYNAYGFFGEAKALFDISGVHGGYELEAALGAERQFGRFGFEAKLGARYRDKKLNFDLYGVSAAHATATRKHFTPDASVAGFASIGARYFMSEDLSLIGNVSVENIGKMKDSPLVERDHSIFLTIGIMKSF
jgi:outer membrane scaffolding protein for murein synthesis (MipA/OmpV family)